MTGKMYEVWRWVYCHGNDYAGDQSIKNETAIIQEIAIKYAIVIVIGDQTCNRDQVGADHNKRSGSGGCVPYHVLAWTMASDRYQ